MLHNTLMYCLLTAVIALLPVPTQAGTRLFPRDAKDTTLLSLLPGYTREINGKSRILSEKVRKLNERSLKEYSALESKLMRKLAKLDSAKYAALKACGFGSNNPLQGLTGKAAYLPTLDSLAQSLEFLKGTGVPTTGGELGKAMNSVAGLEGELQSAANLQALLKQKQELLLRELGGLPLSRELKRLSKKAYYYNRQFNEYKEMFRDAGKAEKKVLELLGKTEAFKKFMAKNSALAGMFSIPGSGSSVDPTSLEGLQTREQVNNLIASRVASGGPNAAEQFRQNISEAQAQMGELKQRLSDAGLGSSEDIMPSGFKPNDQKTRSFLRRLEWGTNLQTTRASYYFPATTDIGMSLGYKLSSKGIIGIGGSYKLGLGRGWDRLALSHGGMSLRSFVDIKLKGSFWISGGYERHLREPGGEGFPGGGTWQQSGLLGLSKQVSMKSKLLKKAKLQLLWDFLGYRQVPRAQPVIFRIGYGL